MKLYIQDNTTLYHTIEDHTTLLYNAIQDYTTLYIGYTNLVLRLYDSIHYTTLCKTIKHYVRLYDTIQHYTRLHNTILHYRSRDEPINRYGR